MEQLETINSETLIEADPATIFAYLTDADRLTRWLGASATLDPRPGGIYLAEVGSGNVSRGEFKEVVPVSRLAYSWGWEKGPNLPPGASLIEIDLIPRNGATLLRLTHSGVPAELAPSHRAGWAHYLARLALAASGRDPGPDRGPQSGANQSGAPRRSARAQVKAKAKPARAVKKKTPARKATAKKRGVRKVVIRKTAAKKTTAKKAARRPAGRRR
jgi:uncharacterized protein YndB with AHSA1/START domain